MITLILCFLVTLLAIAWVLFRIEMRKTRYRAYLDKVLHESELDYLRGCMNTQQAEIIKLRKEQHVLNPFIGTDTKTKDSPLQPDYSKRAATKVPPYGLDVHTELNKLDRRMKEVEARTYVIGTDVTACPKCKLRATFPEGTRSCIHCGNCGVDFSV